MNGKPTILDEIEKLIIEYEKSLEDEEFIDSINIRRTNIFAKTSSGVKSILVDIKFQKARLTKNPYDKDEISKEMR